MKSIVNFYTKNQDEFQPVAGPGNWNDPDMVYSNCTSCHINVDVLLIVYIVDIGRLWTEY